MSPISHAFIAWFIALLVASRVNDRRLIVICGVAADIDGVFILIDSQSYADYHHTFGHSLIFGVMIALVATALGSDRLRVFVGSLVAFGLHLVADVVGSNWRIMPLYPISNLEVSLVDHLSDGMIYNVINPLAILLMFVGIFAVMYRREISPLEFFSEKLDHRVTGWFIYPWKYRCHMCNRRAFAECVECQKKVCARHLPKLVPSRCEMCWERSENG